MQLLRSLLFVLKRYARILWRLWLRFPPFIRGVVYDCIAELCVRIGHGLFNGEDLYHLPFRLRLKYFFDPPGIEANNLKFVRENTSIPGIPDVLDVIPTTTWLPRLLPGLILMKEPKLEGVVTLHDWLRARTMYPPEYYHYMSLIFSPPSSYFRGMRSCAELSDLALSFDKPFLDLSDSPRLIEDLRKALTELRSIIPPTYYEVTGAYGSPLIYKRYEERHVLPPFINVRSFHEMLLGVMAKESHYNVRDRIIRHHRVCFSHSNLTRENILVTDDGRLAAIIDWEAAGWYLDYWDYALVDRPVSLAEARVLNQFWTAVGVFGKGRYDANPEHYWNE